VFKIKTKGNILIIIQRSNGDVYLANSIIKYLKDSLNPNAIDLLINDDTYSVARLIPNIRNILTFSYKKKKENRLKQEMSIIKRIFRKYDLSINLTASDRSVFYALLGSKNSISAIERDKNKSWWKKLFLWHYYYFDSNKHILINNLEPLKILAIPFTNILIPPNATETSVNSVAERLQKFNIKKFIIFHPSAQYNYKIYPEKFRIKLLSLLNELNIPIIVTGGINDIDSNIKKTIPVMKNIYNWVGETSIEEYLALSKFSIGYVGMDTLNMHIASSQNKRIFAIFGPTLVKMWSPWSNDIKDSGSKNLPIQTYGNITLFQADMTCVACGKAGCNNNHGNSDCLDHIYPDVVFMEIKKWSKGI
jgi:heptosyltransferase III